MAGPSIYFITHPNVVISRDVPVPRWPLSEKGRARMRQGLQQPWVKGLAAVYCSNEEKAIDGARILADHLSLPFTELAALGENDRSSTGFLPPPEFERMADAFFASPEVSVRGWERALDAQARVVRAVGDIARKECPQPSLSAGPPRGCKETRGGPSFPCERGAHSVAIVSHGAVGTLLYCHLAGLAIDRRWDQPPNGGGNYFRFTLAPRAVDSWWQMLDDPQAAPPSGG